MSLKDLGTQRRLWTVCVFRTESSHVMLPVRHHGDPGCGVVISILMANVYLQPNVRHVVHDHHEGSAANVIRTPGEAHQTDSSQVVDDVS